MSGIDVSRETPPGEIAVVTVGSVDAGTVRCAVARKPSGRLACSSSSTTDSREFPGYTFPGRGARTVTGRCAA